MNPPDAIVEAEYRILRPGGRVSPLFIKIGKLYQISSEEWACGVEMTGLHSRLADIDAQDSLQAIALALVLVRRLLEHFVENGGRLLHRIEDEDIPVAATFGDSSASTEESA